jgi:hypothetical protein
MRSKIKTRAVLLLALASLAVTSAGCVLVVGGDRKAGSGADVEWSGARETTVATRSTLNDDRLAREVRARMQLDSALEGEDITVSSRGEVVTLHGRVSDVARLEHAMRVAADVPGVARVVSRLTIEMEAG